MMTKIVGASIILIAIVMALLTEGILMPIALPIAIYGLTLMGVKIQ